MASSALHAGGNLVDISKALGHSNVSTSRFNYSFGFNTAVLLIGSNFSLFFILIIN